MNPIAKELWEEGVAIDSFRLVSEGRFEEEGVKKLFFDVAKRPGSSATRRIDHNITDLQGEFYRLMRPVLGADHLAAISANVRGIKLVHRLFEEFGTEKVLFNMKQIQRVAQETVKAFLRAVHAKFGGRPLRAHDYVSGSLRYLLLLVELIAADG